MITILICHRTSLVIFYRELYTFVTVCMCVLKQKQKEKISSGLKASIKLGAVDVGGSLQFNNIFRFFVYAGFVCVTV